LKLEPGARAILARARIGMLSIHAGRQPLVNPAAFRYGDGSVWMTTSRYATKLVLARRDPRAGFLVGQGDDCVLLLGTLEAFDPLSVGGQLRAALQGPGLYLNVAGYALKNAAFIGGYLLDLARIPSEWWPQNRVLLRLRVERAHSVRAAIPAPAEAVRVPGVPARLARTLGRVGAGFACWHAGGYPVMAPVRWTATEDGAAVVLANGTPAPPRRASPGAVVVESHHRFRATRMAGACLRGVIEEDPEVLAMVAERYGEEAAEGVGLRLRAARATYWSGFEVTTRALAAAPAQAAVG
jgi:hypothetical protein